MFGEPMGRDPGERSVLVAGLVELEQETEIRNSLFLTPSRSGSTGADRAEA